MPYFCLLEKLKKNKSSDVAALLLFHWRELTAHPSLALTRTHLNESECESPVWGVQYLTFQSWHLNRLFAFFCLREEIIVRLGIRFTDGGLTSTDVAPFCETGPKSQIKMYTWPLYHWCLGWKQKSLWSLYCATRIIRDFFRLNYYQLISQKKKNIYIEIELWSHTWLLPPVQQLANKSSCCCSVDWTSFHF